MNDSCHAAVIHASNCITLRSDMLHMVGILKIAGGISWKLRKMSWIRNGEEVGLHMSESSRCNFMR
jgi:hypothetical protein